jgi:SAM-dependent methyltransferase
MCGGRLKLSAGRVRSGRVLSGTLDCRDGPHRYPVVLGRPILVPAGVRDRWLSPVDEAMGLLDADTAVPLSLPRVREIGPERAVAAVRPAAEPERDAPWDATGLDTKRLRGRARYRFYGGWLQARSRMRRLLEPFDRLPPRVRRWAEAVADAGPRSVLDLASGGGSGVASILKTWPGGGLICATERDLRCTWAVQRKARELGCSCVEALGADVRRLPFPEASFEAVTSLAALQEIQGMSRLVREVRRVLAPGGSWFALYREPETWGVLSDREYRRFAEAADMFRGHEALVRTADRAGLSCRVLGRFAPCPGGRELDYRLVAFRRD